MRGIAALAACAAAAASASRDAASVYYQLDAAWPVGIRGLNVSQVTAVALINSTAMDLEVHVAQRGVALPYFLVFDAKVGALKRTYSVPTLESPHGIFSSFGMDAAGASSSFWVTDIVNGTLLNVDPVSGAVLQEFGRKGNGLSPYAFSAPADIALDGKGTVYVSDGDGGDANRVLALRAQGGQLMYHIAGTNASSAPGQFNSPHSIAYAPEYDHIWVADRGNTRLQIFSALKPGLLLAEWSAADGCFGGAGVGAPWGVRYDGVRKRLIVADGAGGSVYVLGINSGSGWGPTSVPSCSGALLQTIAVPNGLTGKPHELAVDPVSGSFYLCDVGTPATVMRYLAVQ